MLQFLCWSLRRGASDMLYLASMKGRFSLLMELTIWVAMEVPCCLSSSLFKPLQRRCTVCISNRDMDPGYVKAMHFCKAPLWGRRLDLDSLNLTPRFAHRPLLLL